MPTASRVRSSDPAQNIYVFFAIQYAVTVSNPRVHVVSRPCSDSDMLRRLINCCIIIYLITKTLNKFSPRETEHDRDKPTQTEQ